MIRTALLTFVLIALGVGLALPQAATLLGGVESYRRVVLWGLPIAALLLSLVLHPRLARALPEGDQPPGPLPRRVALLAVAALAFALDQSFLAVGYLTGWATFTFGARELGDRELILTALWALPACLVLGIWGWERALRGSVYAGWRQSLGRRVAMTLSVLAGLALSLPSILPGEVRDLGFVGAAVIAVLCREISLVLLFGRGGGLLVAGLYRGALAFVEAFFIHDWHALHFPAYSYVTSGLPFYAARAAAALLALGVVAWLSRTRPERAALAPEAAETELDGFEV